VIKTLLSRTKINRKRSTDPKLSASLYRQQHKNITA